MRVSSPFTQEPDIISSKIVCKAAWKVYHTFPGLELAALGYRSFVSPFSLKAFCTQWQPQVI